MALVDLPLPVPTAPAADVAAYKTRTFSMRLVNRVNRLLGRIEDQVAAAGSQAHLLTVLGAADGQQLCDAHAKLLEAVVLLDPTAKLPTAFPDVWPARRGGPGV